MREDIGIAKRIVAAYKLMLDFYGLRLHNEMTGEITRSENWQSRFENLNTSFHNNLRINRILTSLGHLGFSRYKLPLLCHFEQELDNGYLTSIRQSLHNYWKKTMDVDSQEFKRKTLELPEDREDSVFFR